MKNDKAEDFVRIFDTTLRDGEQSPGCTMNVEEKLVVARQLEALGVDVIEAGFAAASPGDLAAVRAVAQAVKGPVVLSLARTREADIVKALKAVEGTANPGIHVFIATSDLHLKEKLGIGRSEALEQAVWAVEFARQHVGWIEFSAEDASRSDVDYLVEIFSAVISAGATVCNVPDTTGYGIPGQMRDLFRFLRKQTPGGDSVIWSTHNHNDLGLAVANSLAAVEGGARQVECTLNGIGERAGNTSLEEVVMALDTRRDHFGIATRVQTTHIYPACQVLSHTIGVSIAPTKAIVGANAFAHEAGIHQDGVMKNPLTYEIMRPERIGRPSNSLPLGKHSSRKALFERLAQLGVDMKAHDANDVFMRFKALGDSKKDVTDEDLLALVGAIPSKVSGPLGKLMYRELAYREFVHLVGKHGPEGFLPTRPLHAVKVSLEVNGRTCKAPGYGDGLMDAICDGVRTITGINPILEKYGVSGVTGGTDALAQSVCVMKFGEVTVVGKAQNTDQLEASVYSYLDGINRLCQAHQARGVDILKKS